MGEQQVTKKPDTREVAKKNIEERLTRAASNVIKEAASIMVEGLAGQKESLDKTNKDLEGVSSRLSTVEEKQSKDHSALEAKQKAIDSVVTTNTERISKVESRQEEVSRLKVQAQAASAKADEVKSAVEEVQKKLDQKPEDEVVSRVGDLEKAHDGLDRKVNELSSKDTTPTKGIGLDTFQEMASELFGTMINDVKETLEGLKREVAELKERFDSKESKPAEVEPVEKPEPVEEKPKLQAVASVEEAPEQTEPVPEAIAPEQVDEALAEVEPVEDTTVLEGKVTELEVELEKVMKQLGYDIPAPEANQSLEERCADLSEGMEVVKSNLEQTTGDQ